ncbi:MAG: hypothetical protein KDA51_12305, partial [Planctomycetales bacterium]|nr:hypothetical protein [Planctomycetales bacterium]
EICDDGIDNDCNGKIDDCRDNTPCDAELETCPCTGQACLTIDLQGGCSATRGNLCLWLVVLLLIRRQCHRDRRCDAVLSKSLP